MKITYLRKSDIKKLKDEHMGKRIRKNKTKHNSKNNSSTSYDSSLRNDKFGKDFKEKIRNILIIDYN